MKMQISVRPHIPEFRSTGPKEPKKLLHLYGWDMLVVLAMGILLYAGLSWQIFSDVPVYQCYAVAFWGGLPALNTLPSRQCLLLTQPHASFISTVTLIKQMQAYHLPAPLIHFVASQTPNQPLHALPYEYPLPAIIPFTLPMLASSDWYPVAFAIVTSLVAAVIYGLLRHFRSRWAALVYAHYLVIGGWATAYGHFDLVPAALTLVAIIFGVRKRWNWAFAFLALATVFKFYPLVLLIPFLLAQQLQSGEKWHCWRRCTPLAVFTAVCLVVMVVSLCLSVAGTLTPFIFFENRPFQVETAAASVLWVLSFLGYPLHPVSVYGSFSVLSPLASQVSLVDTVLLGAGLIYTWWLQWRGKTDLVASCLLTLLIVIFTGKVFSPQYLIWIIPLAAYVGQRNLKWIVAWCLLGGLTMFIFPYLYMLYIIPAFENVSSAPLFYAGITIRNLFIFCMIVSLFFSYSRKQAYTTASTVDMKDIPVTLLESPVREQEQTSLLESSHQPQRLWHKLALGAVLAISAFFNFYALARQDFFEDYYAAAVKSMLMSWHNLFFASFDPAGFLALDKPPLGFWMQVLSARLFGFSVFSILLPEALAGVLTVALVFHLVRRVFGPLAGLIAALVLALSPISVVTNRNNIIDSLLVLTVLLAAWAVSKAAETGRFRWLCLCAVLLGLGFNIKLLQAYMVIPAFGLLYVLGAPVRWRTKLGHLALALVVLLLVSLCWATIVDLTPAGQHPYVDSSPTNSELDLAFGFDGIFRLTASSSVVYNWAWEIGRPGITRFFEPPVAGQSSWLLPLALLSLLALSWQRRWRLPLKRRQQALVLWGTWLLTLLVFFSNAHYFHLYYLSMLAPAIAALVGAGIVTLWQDYVRRGWRGWLLPSALLITGIVQAYFLTPFPQWSSLLTASIVGLCTMVELVLVLVRWRFPLHLQHVAVVITALGLLSLLLAPTVWAALPLSRAGWAFPIAGPSAPQTDINPNLADPALEGYLLAHKGKAHFLLATMNTAAAAPIILDTGQAVMALGGYDGRSSFLTSDDLIQLIDSGTLRFLLLPPSIYGDPIVINWVSTHCGAVPTNQWQSRSTHLPSNVQTVTYQLGYGTRSKFIDRQITNSQSRFAVDELQLYDCAHHT